jgi:tRNA threonylcarbamoyladenosine biosynthesis protein TsaB
VKILSLETTDPIGSVAAAVDENLLAEFNLNANQRSAQSLPPGIKSLLESVNWMADDVEFVALTIGPGSFTGLRVGITMAKTFAYAVDAQVLGVNTLDVIAETAPADVSKLTAAVDAQRGDVVLRKYQRQNDGLLMPTGEQCLMPFEHWLLELSAGDTITGPLPERMLKCIPPGINVLEPRYRRPIAGMVAKLARREYEAGQRDDIWSIAPKYSRRSAAEEKLLDK